MGSRAGSLDATTRDLVEDIGKNGDLYCANIFVAKYLIKCYN
jgi:hypothetical protein